MQDADAQRIFWVPERMSLVIGHLCTDENRQTPARFTCTRDWLEEFCSDVGNYLL